MCEDKIKRIQNRLDELENKIDALGKAFGKTCEINDAIFNSSTQSLEERKTYKAGDTFITPDNFIYMLCKIDNYKVALMAIGHTENALIHTCIGNRWVVPIEVKDPYNITEEDFHNAAGGEPENFEPCKILISVVNDGK